MAMSITDRYDTAGESDVSFHQQNAIIATADPSPVVGHVVLHGQAVFSHLSQVGVGHELVDEDLLTQKSRHDTTVGCRHPQQKHQRPQQVGTDQLRKGEKLGVKIGERDKTSVKNRDPIGHMSSMVRHWGYIFMYTQHVR